MTVDNCVFTGFNDAVTMSVVAGTLYVHNSVFRNNLFGIGLLGPTGEGRSNATIDNCDFEQDDTGIVVSGKASANIRNSIFANNTSRGIQIRSTVIRQQAEALV